MPNGEPEDLDDQIESRFLDSIDEQSEISSEVVAVIEEQASLTEFGGRDQLEERLLEVKNVDAD